MLGGLEQHDPRTAATQPLEGITEWQNPRNGIFVCEVRYTADPAKRSPEWKQRAHVGLDERAWAREYDIAWDTGAGTPVFPEYSATEMRKPFAVIPGARLLRFWDFGHVCPVTLFAQVDLYGRLRVLANLILDNSSLEQQIVSTKALSLELMGQPNPPVFDAGDPAGEKEMDLGSVRATLMRHGILLHCQPSNASSYDNLKSRFRQRVMVPEEGPSPAFLLHPRCEVLNTALTGGFHRSEKTGKPVDVHPDKDVCDALRYGNDNLLGIQSDWMKQMREAATRDQAW